MSGELVVYKSRTNTVQVSLGRNITGETFTSEVRSAPDLSAPLIMTWTVAVTNAATGELTLTVDDSITDDITANSGYMDIKRVVGGEPLPLFDRPIEVIFRGAVTA